MTNRDIPRGPFKSLVVLGESTVEGGGWLSGPEERYADLLWHLLEQAQETPVTYHNAGVGASVISPASPGYEASIKPSAAEHLDDEVIAHHPDLLVVAYGLNDMRGGMTVDHFKAEFVKVLDRIEAGCGPMMTVIVNVYRQTAYCYYPPFDKGGIAQTEAYNEMLRQLSIERGYVYADIYSDQAAAKADHLIHADTVHANKVGNMVLANKIFEAIALAAPGITESVDKRDAETPWTKHITEWQGKRVEPSHDSYNDE
jgi:lysophospholipase L1-like esterase